MLPGGLFDQDNTSGKTHNEVTRKPLLEAGADVRVHTVTEEYWVDRTNTSCSQDGDNLVY
jgi:hypothetical protein